MKRKLLLLYLFAVCTSFFAQTSKFKTIPNITEEDLKETQSKIQPDAPAEILFRSVHHSVDITGKITSKYIQRIKIYNKDKAEAFLNPEIPTYSMDYGRAEQTLSGLSAYTYNLEGGKIKAEKTLKDSKFKSKEDKNYTITKLAFPNVQNGSIIELKYEIYAPSNFLMMMPRFIVDQEIPTRYVDYFLDVPKFLAYNINYQGDLIPTYRENAEKQMFATDYYVYRFGYENLHGYEPEAFVLNNDNYKTSIRAELNSTFFPNQGLKKYSASWDDIAKRLNESEDFGLQLRKLSLVKTLLPEDITKIASEKDRADAILKFVQKNFTWNNEVSVWTEGGIRNLINTKTGNSAEINLLLIMLMRSTGLKVNPIVTSTVSRGQISDYSPTITQLNYVFAILETDKTIYYYDATSKYSDAYELPQRALNRRAVAILGDNAEIVNVHFPKPSKTYLTVDAKLNSDGTISGTFSDTDTELYGNFAHEDYLENKDEYHKKYKERYTFATSNLSSALLEDGSFRTGFDFNSDSFVDVIGQKIVFNPLLFLFTQNHDFNQKQPRKAPLEFYSASEKIKKVTITIPDGFVFENVPKSKKIRTDDNSIFYEYRVNKAGNQIVIETKTVIADILFPAEYYTAFKQIFDNITKIEGEVVTAVKK